MHIVLERAQAALVDQSLSAALALAADERPTLPTPAPSANCLKRRRKDANARAREAKAMRKCIRIITSAPKTIPSPPPVPDDGQCCNGRFFHENDCPHYVVLSTWRDRGAR